ncbi:MAG TPA: permease [Candidatus Limnocylindria bacterium]|nr:permease [Candidatus Limnocylindria bacterium]
MDEPKKGKRTGSLLIVAGICVILAGVAVWVGGLPRLRDGIGEAAGLLVSVAPQLALGFLMAGLVTVLVPQATIARLVGEGSGIQGLMVATAAGAVTPGGPFLQFPLVAVLMRSGASEGAVAAYLTAWSLLGLQRVLVWEVPVLGPQFAIARWTSSLIVPIFVGLAVPFVLRLMRAPS